jgi:DNA-binding MarR family transcriptional regulator
MTPGGQRTGGDGPAKRSDAVVDVDQWGPAQLVMTLAGHIRRSRLAALEPFGLAPHQARAFMIVGRHSRRGDLRPSDLARRLEIAPRSVTEVLDALQDKGLIARRPSATDRRATVLTLTESGRELFARMRQDPAPGEDRMFAALTTDELDQLVDLLRKVTGSGRAGPC